MIIKREKSVQNILIVSMILPIAAILLSSVLFLSPGMHLSFLNIQPKLLLQNNALQGFSVIFLSIILEAFPFIMVGTLLSSIIQIFVSEETLSKIIPKNRFLGILCAALIGLVLPICDCAIVPVVRRLIKKGMPLHIAVTFMLAVPIANPVVLFSTYNAFSNNINMVLLRGGLGVLGAMIIGNLMSIMEGKTSILKGEPKSSTNLKVNYNMYTQSSRYKTQYNEHNHNDHDSHNHSSCEEHDHLCSCGHDHNHSYNKNNPISILSEIINHTSIELHDVGRFLIMGAFISALMQTLIPRKYILLLGQNNVLSIIVMIWLAFILAICSETDAFIAKTFVGQFTTGSIIAFLIFGPMIDLKNTFMLSSTFKFNFVAKLIFVIFSICFIFGALINCLSLNGVLSL